MPRKSNPKAGGLASLASPDQTYGVEALVVSADKFDEDVKPIINENAPCDNQTAAEITPKPAAPKRKRGGVKAWPYTHVPLTAEEQGRNGRQEGRNLIAWSRPRMAEKLLLHIEYECNRFQIDVPWNHIAHRFHPGSSDGALQQHFNRLRSTLVAEGHLIPPMTQNQVSRVKVDQTIRGYVRKHIDTDDTVTLRPVPFTEPLDDRKFNLPDAYDNKAVLGSEKRRQMGGGRRHPVRIGAKRKAIEAGPADNAETESKKARRSSRGKPQLSYAENNSDDEGAFAPILDSEDYTSVVPWKPVKDDSDDEARVDGFNYGSEASYRGYGDGEDDDETEVSVKTQKPAKASQASNTQGLTAEEVEALRGLIKMASELPHGQAFSHNAMSSIMSRAQHGLPAVPATPQAAHLSYMAQQSPAYGFQPGQFNSAMAHHQSHISPSPFRHSLYDDPMGLSDPIQTDTSYQMFTSTPASSYQPLDSHPSSSNNQALGDNQNSNTVPTAHNSTDPDLSEFITEL